MSPIPLDPFELHHILGQGGMGEVWYGVHRAQQIPVAVKVITRYHLCQPDFLEAFRHEVQAVARLNHPGIVMVLDHGTVGSRSAALSGEALAPGSPYLVMEHVSGGTLRSVPKPMEWPALKNVLVSLLAALAHSHARGVIHLDLKLSNVLLAGPGDLRPGIKLSDFGIAHALEETRSSADESLPMGTLQYMSPEQIQGDWRDFGPWTDLYGLGCLAYRLATGHPPFRGDGPTQLVEAHIHQKPARFTVTYDLPGGFESWVFRLLQKSPAERFQCAADASRALLALDPDDSTASADRSASLPGLSSNLSGKDSANGPPSFYEDLLELTKTDTLAPVGTPSGTRITSGLPDPDDILLLPCSVPPISFEPACPQTPCPSPPLQLVGAGLGLYGLREIPLVDRDQERGLLWRALRRVHQDMRPHSLLLHGPAGFGKSRLANWLCRQAHECGVANVLKATHGPITGPHDGIAPMLARHFRCVGLDRSEMLARTEKQLRACGADEEREWLGLVEMMLASATREQCVQGRRVRFSTPQERYHHLGRVLQRLGSARPLVLWLDDVQWGADALGLATYLLEEREQFHLSLLLLLTARDEALAERPLESGLLEGLLELSGTQRHYIGPLAGPDHRDLIQGLLKLEGDLAAQVEHRTAGNPLFAVQLVGDWVHRGVLEVGETGFALKPGEQAVLPDDIQAVWEARLGRLLEEYAPAGRDTAQVALELAAALGCEVDRREWRRVCELAGVPYPSDLPAALIASHLAQPTETGWSFVHRMFCETLERLAQENGRWRSHNHVCAVMLGESYYQEVRGVQQRLGLHLLAAQQYESALEPLLKAATDNLLHNDFGRSLELVAQRERALDLLSAPPDDLRRAQGWLIRCRNLLARTDLEGALAWAERSAEAARIVGSDAVLAESLRLVAWNYRYRGRYAQSLEIDQQALALFSRLSEPLGTVKCLYNLGLTRLLLGDLDQAWSYFDQSRALSHQIHNRENWAACLRGLAQVAMEKLDRELAESFTRQALQYYLDEGDRYGEAECLNGLGEILRARGDLDQAEIHYQKAARLFESLGTAGEGLVASLNQCMVLLAKAQYSQTRDRLEALSRECARRDMRRIDTVIHCLMLVPLAAEQDWQAFRDVLERASFLLTRTGLAERDLGWALQLAGDLAWRAGAPGLARPAYTLAFEVYDKLGNQEKVQEVQLALDWCSDAGSTEDR